MCMFTKNTVNGMKYKAFYEVENYCSVSQMNFLSSLARKKFASGDFRSSHQTPSSPSYLIKPFSAERIVQLTFRPQYGHLEIGS